MKTMRRWTSKELKACRERMGESQDQFARRFNVTRPTYAHWEWFGCPIMGTAPRVIDIVMQQLEKGNEHDTNT